MCVHMNLSMHLLVLPGLQYIFNQLANFNQNSEREFFRIFLRMSSQKKDNLLLLSWKKIPMRIQSILNIRKSRQAKAIGDKISKDSVFINFIAHETAPQI